MFLLFIQKAPWAEVAYSKASQHVDTSSLRINQQLLIWWMTVLFELQLTPYLHAHVDTYWMLFQERFEATQQDPEDNHMGLHMFSVKQEKCCISVTKYML